MRNTTLVILILVAAVAGSGCSRKEAEAARSSATLVSTAVAETRDVPVVLRALGRLQSRVAPAVAAEVDGRILRLLVDEGAVVEQGAVLAELDATPLELERRAAQAESARVEALLSNAARRVRRLEELHRKGSIAREPVDDAEAERAVLQAQQRAAQARLAIVEDQLAKTVIRAPVAGRIERRMVSEGDFVRRGTALLAIATSANLRAMLPFPEAQAPLLAPGLAVTLRSPVEPDRAATGVIAELRPAVGEASRAIWAIVDLENPGSWRPEATVFGEVTAATHKDAVVVPVQSVVRRPAGEVIYAIANGKAAQRIVQLGERLEQHVEITVGLASGEIIAVDGASYLSDGAAVRTADEAPK